MKYFYYLSFVLISSLMLAQSHKGESFTQIYGLEDSNVPVKVLSADISNFQTQKMINGMRVGPIMIGKKIEVNDSPYSSGTWVEVGNGYELWRYSYQSNDAKFLSFLLNNLVLKNGAKLDFYSDYSYFGGITEELNLGNQFLTGKIQGSKVTIEFLKKINDNESGFIVDNAYHGIIDNNFHESGSNTAFGINDSDDCEFDADCPLGNSVNDQKKSAVQLLISTNSGLGACSGALINNTAQDGTPYILTAYHCFNDTSSNFNINPGNNAVCNVYINLKATNPACPGNNSVTVNAGSFYSSSLGLTMKSEYQYSDFALMEMNAAIPSTWDVYFSGWDRSTVASTSSKCLHYPNADVMKVSEDINPVTAIDANVGTFVAQLWQIGSWENGVTEPGSSGSPLFNQNNRIVGQLLGGTSYCNGSIPDNGSDYYGRLSSSWTGGGTATSRLSNWLDPTNTGVTSMDGEYLANMGVEDIDVFNDLKITFSPNPVNNQMKVQWQTSDYSLQYEMVNSLGQVLNKGLIANNSIIDVSNLETGVYFIKLYKEGNLLQTEKVLKQ